MSTVKRIEVLVPCFGFLCLMYFSAFPTNFLHSLCIEANFNGMHYEAIYEALLCGKKLENPAVGNFFQQFGFAHLIVVSGFHIQFFVQLLNHIPFAKVGGQFLIQIVLVCFGVNCLLYPPIFRALLQYSISRFNENLKLHWPQEWLILLTGCMALLIHPSWIKGISLQLSWVCAILLSWPLDTKSRLNLKRCSIIYFGLLPFSLSIPYSGPISILCNWLLAPVVLMALIVSSLVSTTSPIADDFLFHSIEIFKGHFDIQQVKIFPPTIYFQKYFYWFYIGILTLIQFGLVRRSRSIV